MSEGRLLHGQQFNPTDPVVYPYTQQECDKPTADSYIGQAGVEITPTDRDASLVKIYDLTEIQAALDEEVLSFPGRASFDLPDTLVSVVIQPNFTYGTGLGYHPAAQQEFVNVGDGSGTINPRSRATGSAAIILDAQPVIRRTLARGVPSMQYFFYMEENYTEAELLARLSAITGSSVLAMPNFKPVSHILTLKGESVSVQLSADTSVRIHSSGANYGHAWEYGTDAGKEVGLTVKTVEIPPTIHALITLSPTTQTTSTTVTVDASSVPLVSDAELVAAISNAAGPISVDVTATVTPTSLAATSPAAIPTSGLKLIDVDNTPGPFDRVRVFAEVVDFSYFA